ncbi:unnamed protein product [Porites evermanni]|uniref:Homeobox domain-containing protein n=1 Tax=Porites evermanni TaxID=104178 RepID=A0ABN8QBU5_9CNID|nr:unnamed protein product [Porites evermanni]
MADKRADLAAKNAAELDRELDEYIESLKKKADGKLRKPEVTEENWQEEFEKVPAFMTKTPTQEEIDSNPALAALQALKYEDDDPVAKAEAYKEDGNYAYKNKKFHDAIVAYTEGIKAKCKNVELNAILYTNRATAQWCLGNYRSAINDATVARKLQPTYMKAILRGASACVEVQRYDEALKWCDDGLAIEPENKKLLDLRNKSVTEQKRVQRDQRKAMMKEKKEKSKVEALLSAVKDRGVHLEHQDDLTRSISDGGLDVKVHLDTDGVLHWPVLFVYPEFNQTDLISSFNENDRISDHLHTMFEVESPPWDVEKKYKPESLEVYFEDASSEKLCLVKNNKCLKDVLSDSSVFNHVASIYADFLEQKKAFTKERVQLPQDWFGRPTWTQFHCKNALYISDFCKKNVEGYYKSIYKYFFVMNNEATHRCDELRVICYYDNHRSEQHPRKTFLEHTSGLDFSLAYFCDSDLQNLLPQDQQTKVGHHKRTHFTVLQRRELEKIFSESQYLTPQKRESISQQLGITEEVIQTWFKNRRVKWRKDQRKRQSVVVSTPPSLSTGLYFHYFGHVPYPSSKLMLKDARMLYGSAASPQD